MNIHLNDSDISQMPEQLRNSFLHWLTKKSQAAQAPASQHFGKPQTPPTQLVLNLESQTPEQKPDYSRVRLTQLFDAGITKQGMPVRVRLKQQLAKQQDRQYINNLEICAKGTIVYNSQEYDQPSPLAAKINGGAVNGWEYIEVKKNDQWVCLDQLRITWRKTND